MLNDRLKRRIYSSGLYDCLCDPYDKHNTGDYYGSIMDDLDRFAQMVAEECASIAYNTAKDGDIAAQAILYEFDVDGARSQK